MGWTGYGDPNYHRSETQHLSDVVVVERTPARWTGYDERAFWLLTRTPREEKELIVYVIARLIGCEWIFKDVDETMGPLAYDCPPQWLDRTEGNFSGTFSDGWRAQCRYGTEGE